MWAENQWLSANGRHNKVRGLLSLVNCDRPQHAFHLSSLCGRKFSIQHGSRWSPGCRTRSVTHQMVSMRGLPWNIEQIGRFWFHGSGIKLRGTGTFGGKGELFGAWGNTDVAEARRLVDICLDAGVSLFDSADIYSDGVAESILGEASIEGQRIVSSSLPKPPFAPAKNQRSWLLRIPPDRGLRVSAEATWYGLHRSLSSTRLRHQSGGGSAMGPR